MENKLIIYNGLNEELYSVDINESTVYHGAVMVEDYISAVIIHESELTEISPLNGSYIFHKGTKYKVNQRPKVHQTTENTFVHYVNFEGPMYDLDEVNFEYHGNSYDPQFIGNADEFMDVLIFNLQRAKPGTWSKGTVASTDRKFVAFTAVSENGVSCRNALAQFAQTAGLEFQFDGYTIHLDAALGRDTEVVFKVGQGKGLLDLERFYPDDYKEYNRLKVLGSDKNISPDYRSGTPRLTFDPGYVERPLNPGEEVREATVVVEDIFPERTGTITAVSDDGLSFSDSSIDFDLDEYRVTGVQPQVHFKSGQLIGKTFELIVWDNDTKTITLEPLVEVGYQFPSDSFKIQVGDTYTLWDIEQPASYIADAEYRLSEKALELKDTYLDPSYTFNSDYKYLVDNNIIIKHYDRVRVEDPTRGVSKYLRVNSVSYPLINTFNINFELSNAPIYTIEEKKVIEQEKQKQIIKEIDITKREDLRKEAYWLRKLRDDIFDPVTGENTKISATLIQAMMAIFGNLSLNLSLPGVAFEDNYLGNSDVFRAGAGKLVHFDPEILAGTTHDGEWILGAEIFEDLEPETALYLYAKCPKNNVTASWVLTDEKLLLNHEEGFWHFYIGILQDDYQGYRKFVSVFGVITILGNQMKAGIVSDHLENLIINLDEAYIQGELRFKTGEVVEDVVDGIFQDAADALDAANTASGKADNALTSINYMSADNKLTPLEKLELRKEINIIQNEYSQVILEATRYSVATTGYQNAYTNLINYTNPLLSNMSVTTDIIRNTFNTHFSNYFYQKAALFNAISGAAKTAAENYTNGQISTFSTSLGDLAYNDLVSLAKLDETVIEGGFLKTNLIDVDWLKATAINADYIESLELVSKIIRTANSGKRVEINDVTNNISIYDTNGKLLQEFDDDSAQSTQVFYLEFNILIPAGNIRNWESNWGTYNSNFLGSNNPQWSTPDFAKGFPDKFTNVIENRATNVYRYYFYYGTAGTIVHNSGSNGLYPKTSMGSDASYYNNLFAVGGFGTGQIQNLPSMGIDTDFLGLDRDIIIDAFNGQNVALPVWLNASNQVQPDVLGRAPYGRELRLINISSVFSFNITTIGNKIRNGSSLVNSYVVPPKHTITLKVSSTDGSPISVTTKCWQIIAIESNDNPKTKRVITATYILNDTERIFSIPYTGNFTVNLPPNPIDGQKHEFVRAHSTGVTLNITGNGREVVYKGTVYGSPNYAALAVTGYHGTAIYIKEENRWYLSSYT